MPFIKHIPPKESNECNHPEHNPPTHIVLKPGAHVYKCPGCGEEQTVYINDVRM